MKKALVITGLLLVASTSVMAEDSGLYMGLDVFTSSNTLTIEASGNSFDIDNDSDGFKLKFGSSFNNDWRLQGYYQHETYDTQYVLSEIGIDVIKGFEITPEFVPFIQAGLGIGWTDDQSYLNISEKESSAKVGAGIMYKITPMFEAIAGVDFQYRNWSNSESVFIDERSTKLYIGANIHF